MLEQPIARTAPRVARYLANTQNQHRLSQITIGSMTFFF